MLKVFIGFVTTALFSFGVTQVHHSPQGNTDPVSQEARGKPWFLIEKQKPTTIEEGKVTEKQKEHRKLYNSLGGGKKFRDVPAEQNGAIVLSEPALPAYLTTPQPFDLQTFLNKLACESDAVIVAVPSTGTSQLAENEDFIFTDYEMTVDEVLRGNSRSPISIGEQVTVTRAGGAVLLNGKVFRAIERDFRFFKVGGRYLLFLKFIHSTRAYQAFGKGSYQIEDGKITSLSLDQRPTQVTNDIQAFIGEAYKAITAGCDHSNRDTKKQ